MGGLQWINLRVVDRMQDALEEMRKRAIPYAARDLVNSLAFEGRRQWQREMRQSFTLRNAFTERRALVKPTRSPRIADMQAVLGHTEHYMALLEEGHDEPAAKLFRAIPTEIAAGQAFGSLRGGRKTAVKARNIITKIGRNLKVRGAEHRTRKQQNQRAVVQAISSGRRLAWLDFGKRRGVYRVKGPRRKPKLEKVYDITRRKTRNPTIPTLERAVAAALQRTPHHATRALERQFARIKGGT